MAMIKRDVSGTSARGVLLFLFLVNVVNYIDRLLFAILQEPIKRDLALTDFQLGLLGGPAFAILYSLAALPIARIADRTGRVKVISTILAFWSGAAALRGAATGFAMLLVGRVGVSLGEAGCAPASHALLSETFAPERRTGAISTFTAGGPVGALIAGLAGSALAGAFGWRVTFYICGALGLLLAVAVAAVLREAPARAQEARPAMPVGAAIKVLAAKPSFLHLAGGMSLATLSAYVVIQYLTSFLMRAHGLPLTHAAGITGLMVGGVSPIVGLISDTIGSQSLRGSGLTLRACATLTGNLDCAAAEVAGLRWGLIAITAPMLWAALHFRLSERTIATDIAASRAGPA